MLPSIKFNKILLKHRMLGTKQTIPHSVITILMSIVLYREYITLQDIWTYTAHSRGFGEEQLDRIQNCKQCH